VIDYDWNLNQGKAHVERHPRLALGFLKAAERARPESAEVQILMARAELRLGHIKNARERLEKAAKLGADKAEIDAVMRAIESVAEAEAATGKVAVDMDSAADDKPDQAVRPIPVPDPDQPDQPAQATPSAEAPASAREGSASQYSPPAEKPKMGGFIATIVIILVGFFLVSSYFGSCGGDKKPVEPAPVAKQEQKKQPPKPEKMVPAAPPEEEGELPEPVPVPEPKAKLQPKPRSREAQSDLPKLGFGQRMVTVEKRIIPALDNELSSGVVTEKGYTTINRGGEAVYRFRLDFEPDRQANVVLLFDLYIPDPFHNTVEVHLNGEYVDHVDLRHDARVGKNGYLTMDWVPVRRQFSGWNLAKGENNLKVVLRTETYGSSWGGVSAWTTAQGQILVREDHRAVVLKNGLNLTVVYKKTADEE